MAKVSPKKAVEDAQPKTYFSSEYRFQKVAGLSLGTSRYFIFIRPQDNLYSSMVHSVKAKSDKAKFKNNPFPKIKCASYDIEGNKLEEPGVCCQMYDYEKERIPEREKSGARLIDYAKPVYQMPVLVLSHCLTDPKVKSYEVTHVKMDGSQFAYYEFSKKQWGQDILGGLATELKKADNNTGESIIDPSVDGEELQDLLIKYLSKVVVRVDAVDTDSNVDYLPKFTFIPFSAKAIAKVSGEYRKIVNWEKEPGLEEFRNDVAEFLTNLEKEEPNFTVNWTPEELKQYIIGDEQRKENITAYKEAMKKQDEEEAQQVVDVPFNKTQAKVEKVEVTTPIETTKPIAIDINIDEEEFEFDPESDEDFMGLDDEDEVE